MMAKEGVIHNRIWCNTLGLIFVLVFMGGQALAIGPYSSGDNTVVDEGTSLEWQKSDDGTERTWEEALVYCEDLDFDSHVDWRLPNIRELISIIDNNVHHPAMDDALTCQSAGYWASTTFAPSESNAWNVEFNYGRDVRLAKTETSYVRCVRAGLINNGPFDLAMTMAGTGSGSVTFNPPDENCTTSCSKQYSNGSSVTLSAAANDNSTFTGWSGEGCSGTDTCDVTMDQASTVTATFALKTYTVTPTAGAHGSLAPSTAQSVNHGDTLSFTVTPDAHYHIEDTISGCGGSLSGSTYTLSSVTADCEVSASFAIDMSSISASATSGGTITPAGSVTVDYNSNETFSIVPEAHYHILDVVVDGSSQGAISTYQFTSVVSDHSIAASFALDNSNFAVITTGTGSGTVTSTPHGITCGDVCSSEFDYGTAVTLNAFPTPGSSFSGWIGADCTGAESCEITVDSAQIIYASFELNADIMLTVALNDERAGRVESHNGGVQCGDDCTEEYMYNTPVVLTAIPKLGYIFLGWSESSCPGTAPCTVIMNQARSVAARFTKKALYWPLFKAAIEMHQTIPR